MRLALVSLALLFACGPPRRQRYDVPKLPALDPALVSSLSSSYASERARAAFQLGQLGVAWDPVPLEMQLSAEAALVARSDAERDSQVRVEQIAALGRVGRADGRRLLLGILKSARPAIERARAGWALAHLYRRLRKDVDASVDVPLLAEALIAPEAEVRAAVTDALAEVQRPAARPILLRELVDADALARARAAHGLVALVMPDDVPALSLALKDPDERVAAAAALALAQLVERGLAPALAIDVLVHSLDELARPAVVIALAEAGFIEARFAPVFAALEAKLGSDARLAGLAALAHDRAAARLERVAACVGLDEITRSRFAARALAEADPKRVSVATLLAMTPSDHLARATLIGALARYDDAKSAEAIVFAAKDNDLAIRAAAAEAAHPRKLFAAGQALLAGIAPLTVRHLRPEEVDALLSIVSALAVLQPSGGVPILRQLLDGTPAAIALAARAALRAYGTSAVMHPAAQHTRHDDDAWPDGRVIVRLETERGAIRIEVHADWAPKNARNFVGLVRSGFYDGLGFHRTVPGFVAQGGDPRGDGSGGSDEIVACEPNAVSYVEGTVGMALSGLDTGSSQFFISLAPAPHLEGRYTAFAEVIEGMTVARSLEPGDRIERARVE